MEDNNDISLPTSNPAVARATASTMGSSTDQPKNQITPRAELTTSSANIHKARVHITFTSVFVTFETETVTFHPGGSVAPSSAGPTTLVTTTTSASATPEETTGSAPSQTGTQGPKSAVIGGAVGATLFGLLLVFGTLGFCFYRRRRLEQLGHPYSRPTPFPVHGGAGTVHPRDGRFHRLENIPLQSLGKPNQTRTEQHQTAGGGDERGPRQMQIEVVPAGPEDRGPRLRTVPVPLVLAPAHQARPLVPMPSPAWAVPAPYPHLTHPVPAPPRSLRNASSSVYSVPSRVDVASGFSEDSDDGLNNEDNDNSNGNKNSAISSSITVWPAPLFASGSGPAQAAPATGGAAADEPDSSSLTTTPHEEDRRAPSQSSTHVEPPSQSRWSPDTPSSHGSEAGLASRVGHQVAQVGAKLANTWKENKEKLGSLLGSGSKEEKKPTKEEKGKGKAVDREIVVDPVNRGAPGWI
ncbi:hypothetical protein SMACR_08201 [Sordaria macrospora]|uniref:WGS project CABT00000000 data, contig 2.43 n=2 Tax=Sordaria macrospora TaxID=5147 RepID=F7W853_SORMK|nr:uncharacterized protein SMAC_08201 [Sordaria macrospora k-hell]KAA8622041.1 hypothetical protein SMACR_08201 [Sordaria macrospora]WPJ61117.1 hypothetical protein SMAC4_08201 [Sordaria macrospora]CCC13698.1 unnamed protein product [Sordaria macrospora k-hell]